MIIFFIRRYNDIDHTVPVVHHMAKEKLAEIRIVCVNPELDIRNDPRLAYLEDNYGLKAMYIYELYEPGLSYKLSSKFLRWLLGENSRTAVVKRIKARLYQIVPGIYKRLYTGEWANSVLKTLEARILVFDWQEPKLFPALVLDAARNMGIPTLGLPHGIIATTDLYWYMDNKGNLDKADFAADWKFDKVVVQHEEYKSIIGQRGIDTSKVFVMGSARHCEEWREIYKSILPLGEYSTANGNDSGKVKVVFMDHYTKYRILGDVVYDSLSRLVDTGLVDLVIKPSTSKKGTTEIRNPELAGVCHPGLLELETVDYETSSMELIQWADVVMGTHSSIQIEALLFDKVLLYPKYFQENTMLWEQYGACWQVNNYEELEAAFRKLANDLTYKPYSSENVQKLIGNVVYGGQSDHNVLKRYADFIVNNMNPTVKAI